MNVSFASRLKMGLEIRNMKPVELSEKTNISKSRISQYLKGSYEAKQDALYKIAMALDVNEAWLMGYDLPLDRNPQIDNPNNIYKIETRRIPMIGTIAAGQPIVAEEKVEYYVEAGTNIKADFCLKVKGDSMINARIKDGDIVFIRKQDTVEEGQIAAVLIDNEATLKRVYRTNGDIVLMAENPNYSPLIYKSSDGNDIRILGRAIAFHSELI